MHLLLVIARFVLQIYNNLKQCDISNPQPTSILKNVHGDEKVLRSVKWGGGIVSLLITMNHSAPVANKQLQSWEYVRSIYHSKASDRAKT